MQLWRPRSPKTYSWKAGDLGDSMMWFQPEFKGLRTGESVVSVIVQKLATSSSRRTDFPVWVQRQEKTNASAHVVGQEEFT